MWPPLTPPLSLPSDRPLSLQTALSLFVNFLYFILFLYLRPMIFHPISAFLTRTRNLFSLTEVAACVATLTNNVLALFIALEHSSSSSCDTDDDGGGSPLVSNLGAAFAAINVLFIFLTLYAWDRDDKQRLQGRPRPISSPIHCIHYLLLAQHRPPVPLSRVHRSRFHH